jgi:hypothetical protein
MYGIGERQEENTAMYGEWTTKETGRGKVGTRENKPNALKRRWSNSLKSLKN